MQNLIPIRSRYEEIAQSVINRIADEPETFILNTPTNDLAEYYCSPFQVAPMELDSDRTETVAIKKVKRTIPAHQRDPGFRYQGDAQVTFEYLNIQLPILPHTQIELIKRFEPGRYDSGFAGEELSWSQEFLSFDVATRGYGIHKTDEGIKMEVENSIQWVKNRLQLINYELNLYYEQLKTTVVVAVNNRKRTLEATGETFCVKGKTDIYLQLDKGNILSFECKFWDGHKAYLETIDQLLSYLSWRMNYGVIILFSRQKNFSHVLEEAKKAIQGHSSYNRKFHEIKNTHFRSFHQSPGDENKFVQLHHLFYTLMPQ